MRYVEKIYHGFATPEELIDFFNKNVKAKKWNSGDPFDGVYTRRDFEPGLYYYVKMGTPFNDKEKHKVNEERIYGGTLPTKEELERYVRDSINMVVVINYKKIKKLERLNALIEEL
jgi:hypothetical protein